MKNRFLSLLFVALLSFATVGFAGPGVAMAQEAGSDAQAEVDAEATLDGESNHADEEGGDPAESDHAEHAEGDHAEGDHGAEGHEGEGHEDNDPTHANVSDATWKVLDFRTDMAFFSGIVFLLLLFGLMGTVWKPMMDGLQKREDTIANNIANAEKASAEADAKLAEYESKLASANEEAANIVAEARKDAEAAGQKLIASAQEDAVRLKERATSDIETAKRVALGELVDQSTSVAMSVAERVVGREVKADDHQSLIQEMLAKLPSKN